MRTDTATDIAAQRLDACYAGANPDWRQFYTPRREMQNFATRYHLVYPALSYFVGLKQDPDLADGYRPKLDTIYKGLLDQRVWNYWHTELNEPSPPLKERNLTYAGRLATFVGFYIDAFGEPPAEKIEVDGHTTDYRELSANLHHQMTSEPSCGVTCYHHQSMVMCNAHMLINNVLHDRLYGTTYARANEEWLATTQTSLLRDEDTGPLFYYGTKTRSALAEKTKKSVGADIWALFLMSGVVPEHVSAWFETWQRNISYEDHQARVLIGEKQEKFEFSSTPLATGWAYCLSRELGQQVRAELLRNALAKQVEEGFELDPLLSGLFLLGDRLRPGSFHKLVTGG